MERDYRQELKNFAAVWARVRGEKSQPPKANPESEKKKNSHSAKFRAPF